MKEVQPILSAFPSASAKSRLLRARLSLRIFYAMTTCGPIKAKARSKSRQLPCGRRGCRFFNIQHQSSLALKSLDPPDTERASRLQTRS